MDTSLCVLLFAIISQGFAADKMKSDNAAPMVAFMCNKPAMYLTEQGWVRDETTDCLKEPEDILNYCKEVYPDMDITNYVESSDMVTIDNWCSYDHTHCKHHGTHTVRPIRCLVGPFQSDALLVPEHCLFDHIHDPKQCITFKAWNQTASKSCASRRMMQLQSCAILLPCGIDMFSGVEFVCCPSQENMKVLPKKPVIAHKPKAEIVIETKKQDKVEEVKPKQEETEASWEGFEDYSKEESDDEDDDDYYEDEDYEDKELINQDYEKDPAVVINTYDQYMKKPTNEYLNEHDYFSKAKSDLQKHHHEKVTKMMKEWAAARQRVQEMTSSDPKAAEKLNKEITSRFQKTYQALEEEEMAERQQLVAVHQQRIQYGLNEKKRDAMEHFMEILQKENQDANTILRALQHYIKVEQKDKMHSLNHFKHLVDTDPEEAEKIRQQTQDHLDIIQQRINQAIQMLNRVPEFEKKIKLQLDEWMKSFAEVNDNIKKLLAKPAPTEKSVEEKDEEDINESKEIIPEKEVKPFTDKMEAKEPETEKPKIEHVKLSKDVEIEATKYDDETDEDEHVYIDLKPVQANHIADDTLNAEAKYIQSQPMNNAVAPIGSGLGIAIGSIAVFVIIVVGIVVVRKRSQRAPVSHGFVEVDPAASPEERHVANMQMNGYENPTYKYFEMNTTA